MAGLQIPAVGNVVAANVLSTAVPGQPFGVHSIAIARERARLAAALSPGLVTPQELVLQENLVDQITVHVAGAKLVFVRAINLHCVYFVRVLYFCVLFTVEVS